jgi:hypothetical protein
MLNRNILFVFEWSFSVEITFPEKSKICADCIFSVFPLTKIFSLAGFG